MFASLYQYLIEKGEVFIASVGRMQMVAQPAAYDVVTQQLLPPRNLVEVQTDAETPNLQPQMAFLSRELNISEEEAFDAYNDYCDQLKGKLDNAAVVEMDGWGQLQKLPDGRYSFTNSPNLEVYTQPVAAHRVIRKGASHAMMVGTTETTSDAMREMLEEQPVIKKRSLWWVAASIVAFLAIGLIVLRKMQYL